MKRLLPVLSANLLGVLIAFAAPAALAAGLRCEAIFEEQATVATVDPSLLKTVPPVVHLSIEASNITSFFELGRANFERSLGDGTRLQKRLSELAAGQKADPATAAEFKALRKLAIILRSDFILLSTEHEVPESFEKFTKAFGKLNDALEFDAHKLVPAAAAKVLELAERQSIARALDSFEAASPKSVEREITRVRDEILGLASERILSVHDFHEVRKLLKHILTYVQTAQAFDPAPEKVRAYQFLWALNDALGSLRQDSLKQQVKSLARGDEAPDHEREMQKLPASLHRNIRAVLGRLAIARPAKNDRQALALETHVRLNSQSDRWEVLWPKKKDGFEVLEFASFNEAAKKARDIESPLDLEEVRAQAADLLPQVRGALAGALGMNFMGRIEMRVKESESIKQKLFEKAIAKGPKFPWTRITDIMGLRVIVADEGAEATTARTLHEAFKQSLVEEHERDATDGYHAHHLVGVFGDGPRFEIQVMTERMNAWSNWEHDRLYKPVEPLGDEAKANLVSYSRAVVRSLRASDHGQASALPSAAKYKILSRDAFPSPELR